MKKIIVLVIGVLISSCSNDNLIDENSEVLENLNNVELKINGVNSVDNIVDINHVEETCICIFNEGKTSTTNIICDKHKGSEMVIKVFSISKSIKNQRSRPTSRT